MEVRTEDLLRRCRLVSHIWHQTASSICRERRVRLIYGRKKKEINAPHNLYTLFDLENLPWSSYSFTYNNIPPSAQRTEFFQKFGHHFLELRVQVENYESLLDILRWTPNLRSLVVVYIAEMAHERCSYDDLCAKNHDLRLSKLTRLQFNHSPQQTFLEYVLARCGARLEYFKSAPQIDGQEKILSLLQTIPSLSLSITFYQESLSAAKNLIRAKPRLKIHELSISLTQPGEPEQGRKTLFEEAESFLATFSDCLVRLEIVLWPTDSECLTPFKFPKFPKLNFLRMNFRHGKVSTGRFLSGMRGDQFPVLSQIVINLPAIREDRGYVAKYFFPKSCHFAQVRKIKLNVHDSVKDCWSQVFPTLGKFHITTNHDTGVSLDSLFSHPKLEHLSLIFISMDFAEVNAAFSHASIENATGNVCTVLFNQVVSASHNIHFRFFF